MAEGLKRLNGKYGAPEMGCGDVGAFYNRGSRNGIFENKVGDSAVFRLGGGNDSAAKIQSGYGGKIQKYW
jgi:hypothetical protein